MKNKGERELPMDKNKLKKLVDYAVREGTEHKTAETVRFVLGLFLMQYRIPIQHPPIISITIIAGAITKINRSRKSS